MLRSVSRRQYRIAIYGGNGDVIEGAQYMHLSEETPTRGLPIDLPQGKWFVHEVVATWSEDRSSQLDGSDPHYGGTLICRPDAPDSDS
jgi:hypothetical protein